MKRGITLLVCLLLLSISVSANSGPAYWEQAPSFSMTALKDCPVTVEREDLTFDFQSGAQRSDYSPKAEVTAAYQMKNPAKAALSVQMAFPLISSLSDLASAAGVRITADEKNVPFRVLLGGTAAEAGMTRNYYREDGTLNGQNLPSFEQILQSIQAAPEANKKLKDAGKLYQFSAMNQIQPCRLLISFEIKPGKTNLISTGFNGYSSDAGKMELTGWLEPDRQAPLSFLVVGDDIQNLSVKAYGDNEKELPGVKAEVKASAQEVKPFFESIVKRSEAYRAFQSPEFLTQLYNAAAQHIDGLMAGGQTVIDDSTFYDFYSKNRILILAYEIPFAAGSIAKVSVHYSMSGAMDAKTAAKPVYSYGYLLNPAKGWAGFNNLNISVIPPKESPYVAKSSIPMTRGDSGIYSAKLDSLPKSDLTFTLYAKPQITPDGDFLRMILYASACVVIAAAAFIIYRKRKKKSIA